MADPDERVTNLAGESEHQRRAIDGVRIEIAQLRPETTQLRTETAQLRTEVTPIRGEMATRSELSEFRRDMTDRFELTDAKIDRLSVWTVGLMVSGFFGVIGARVGVVYR